MNTRKKIIYTLRSADKASVERLMSEAAKKDEIFAKARERAEKSDGYTDVAEGAEQYNPKIRIFRTASAAAASVLIVTGVWGAVHLLKNSRLNSFEHNIGNSNITEGFTISEGKTAYDENSSVNNDITTVITAKTTASSDGTVTTNAEGSVTSEAASSANEVTTTAENGDNNVSTTTEAKPTEADLSGDQIRDKCIGSVYNYDSFSADFTLSKVKDGNWLYRYSEGTIKLDNSSMNGEMYQRIYTSDGRFYCDEHQYYLNDKFVYAGDHGEGVLIAKITDIRNELPSDGISDRVWYKDYTGLSRFTSGSLNGSVWELTGERNENGRKILSVKARYEGDNSASSFTADIDADTGICLAYDRYLENELVESFRTENVKFNNEADTPPNSHEVREFLENNGYASGMLENFSDYKISDLD